MFFSQTPGRPTPRIIDHGVSTVTLLIGWVGALNQRDPFRVHSGVVGFADRCLPKVLVKVVPRTEPARSGVS